MKTILIVISTSMIMLANGALAQTADFDPRAWKKAINGKPTQVMVLGSPHLRELGEIFKPTMLTGLLDKLAGFKPDIITIEALSGEECDFLKRNEGMHPDVFKDYCWNPEPAEKATGLSVQAALVEIKTTLKSWSSTPQTKPSATQRRHLAALFLAANDRASALVQWLRLESSERKIGDGIDDALLQILNREKVKSNENFDIGSVLAARLGHERVYAIDDHTSDSIQDLAGPKLGEALQAMWGKVNYPELKEANKLDASLKNSDDLLNLYRFYNHPKNTLAFITADFGAGLKQQSPELYGRQYVAWWETRNLRMVANIRSAFANQPGAKVLSIVGASHKPYFDAYLNMMHEVKLIDANSVLK